MRRSLAAAVILGTILSLGAVPAAGAPKRGGTLRVAMEGNVPHLDGAAVTGTIIKFYREIAGSSLVMLNEK
ncbi:MAG: hypothetical protein AABZ64_13530, partial [Nitrospinota bacterium]